MKILLTISLLFLTASVAQAEDTKPPQDLKEYDVEIIIFEDAHARYLNSQTWDQYINNTDENNITENTKTVTEEKLKTTDFKSIKPSILKSTYKRMNVSSEYKILFYGSWRQAGLDKNKAFEINIDELKNNHTKRSKNTLSGNFKLVLRRYLHMYNELEYRRDVDVIADVTDEATENVNINNETYPLKSHRRMRSKELHYIDHPLVGILLQINPVEKTKDEQTL